MTWRAISSRPEEEVEGQEEAESASEYTMRKQSEAEEANGGGYHMSNPSDDEAESLSEWAASGPRVGHLSDSILISEWAESSGVRNPSPSGSGFSGHTGMTPMSTHSGRDTHIILPATLLHAFEPSFREEAGVI
jgi:hypothetical protein